MCKLLVEVTPQVLRLVVYLNTWLCSYVPKIVSNLRTVVYDRRTLMGWTHMTSSCHPLPGCYQLSMCKLDIHFVQLTPAIWWIPQREFKAVFLEQVLDISSLKERLAHVSFKMFLRLQSLVSFVQVYKMPNSLLFSSHTEFTVEGITLEESGGRDGGEDETEES